MRRHYHGVLQIHRRLQVAIDAMADLVWFTDPDCIDWCRKHAITVVDGSPVAVWQTPHLSLPTDVGQRTSACALFLEAITADRSFDELLVWSQDRHVFLSCEHQPLATAWMKGLGGSGDLESTSGLLVTPPAFEHGLSYLLLSAYFFWDCWLINASAGRFVFFSHDEFVLAGSFRDSGAQSWVELILGRLRVIP